MDWQKEKSDSFDTVWETLMLTLVKLSDKYFILSQEKEERAVQEK